MCSLPWCGFGLNGRRPGDGLPAGAPCAAALCVGGGSYTAGFQTITLNICKQIKKQNHPVRMETCLPLSLSLCALSLPPPTWVSEEVGEGGHRLLGAPPAPSLPAMPPSPTATSTDRWVRSWTSTPSAWGIPRHLRRIFLFPGVLPKFQPERHYAQGGPGCPHLAISYPS